MIDIEFVRPSDEDVQFIADTMRPSDVIEVLAAGDVSPLEALNTSIAASEYVSLAKYKDTPLVMFGMGKPDVLTGHAVIWMLGSTESSKYRREFILYTQQIFDEMFTMSKMLYNYIHARNRESVRWLHHLGATFSDPIKLGPYNEEFYRFEVRRQCVVQH